VRLSPADIAGTKTVVFFENINKTAGFFIIEQGRHFIYRYFFFLQYFACVLHFKNKVMFVYAFVNVIREITKPFPFGDGFFCHPYLAFCGSSRVQGFKVLPSETCLAL
jgi:hypothetical protein